jgi:hypothetical protein
MYRIQVKVKGKVVPVLNQAPHHEDILCLIKHHTMKTWGNGDIAPRVSCVTGIRGSFPGGKSAGACICPRKTIKFRGEVCVGLYLHSPSMPSWRDAQLKHRDNLTFTFTIINIGIRCR